MAYNYPYYGQQPYPYQDQLSQLRNQQFQTQAMPPAQPVQYTPPYGSNDNGILWVQGEAGAKSWFVKPGTTVMLMDSEAMRFYLKSADMNGVPAMRTFAYSEVGATKPTASPEAPQFVTVDEFNGFKNEVMGKLDELSAPVEVSLSRKAKKGEPNE